jgi:hypothetical protein
MKRITFLFLSITFLACNKTASKKSEKNSSDTNNGVIHLKKNPNCQILWQGECSYQLCKPLNWLAIGDSLTPIGSGSSKMLVMYEPSPNIIHKKQMGVYSMIIFKDEYDNATLAGFLNLEKERAIKNDEKIIEVEPIKTDDAKNAVIKKYFIDKSKEYYAIAYIEEPDFIIMITFTTLDLDDFDNNYKYFKEIVESYRFFGELTITK